MLNIFIESKTGNNRADMENADHFLEQQITLYEQKLRLAEAKRAEFRAKYIDLLPSDSTGLSRLEAARNTLATLEERLKDAQLHTDMLTKQLDADARDDRRRGHLHRRRPGQFAARRG